MKKENIFKKIGLFFLDILLRIVFAFRDIGLAIWNFITALIKFVTKFVKRFISSDIWTKLSHIFMGLGNIVRGQYVKGIIFFAIECLFITFMVVSPSGTKTNGVPLGGKALANFATLGSYAGMPIETADYIVGNLHEQLIYDDAEVIPLVYNTSHETVDLSDDNQLAKVSLIYRSVNLAKEVNADTNNEAFKVVDNDENHMLSKTKYYYDKDLYHKLIFDNRYNTNDVYALQEKDSDNSIHMYGPDVGAFIVNSDHLFSETELKGIATIHTESFVEPSSNVYLYGSEETGTYTYIVLVDTSGAGKFDDFKVKFKDSNIEVLRVFFKADYVNTAVDNSFLMMLYGVVTIAIIAVFAVIYFLSISSAYKAECDIKEGKKPTTFIEDLKTLLDGRFHITMLAPAIIFILVFTIIPTILMILIAFTNMDSGAMITGSRLTQWNGLDNFAAVVSGNASIYISKEVGRNFFGVVTWTFEWAIIATFSCYFGGIFLALLLNRKDVKLKKFWRTIFVMTIAIPQFITLLIIKNMLKDSGPINNLLLQLHITSEPIDFLQQGSGFAGEAWRVWLARASVLVINLYIGIPYSMLMTSGILMNIPSDLYEAATIDGANKWQMFKKITLPYVIFVTTPYLISSFIGNITSFNSIFLTTGGGPTVAGSGSIAGKTDLLVTWLYKLTIDNYKYNAGSIIGIITFLITAFITLICYRNSKAYKEEDTFQ